MIVFIVDDSDMVRNKLVEMVKEFKDVESVYAADTVVEAQKILDEIKPDIAIIDISMPEGSGFDVLIRTKMLHPETTTVMLTSYVLQGYKEKSMRLGADYFLKKPGGVDKVLEIIKKYKHKNTVENEQANQDLKEKGGLSEMVARSDPEIKKCPRKIKKVLEGMQVKNIKDLFNMLKKKIPQGQRIALVNCRMADCPYWHSWAFDYYCDNQERIDNYLK